MTKKIISAALLLILSYTSTYSQDFISRKFGESGNKGIEDFDQDGNIDILAIPGYTSEQFYMNYHDGSLPLVFKSRKILPKGSYRAAFDTVDMDADGDMDVLTVKDNKLVYLVNKSTPGKFVFEVLPLPIDFTTNYVKLKVIDMDADGDMDIVSFDYNTGHIMIFYKTDSGYTTFQVDIIEPSPVDGNIRKLEFADFNGDGLMDFVIGCNFTTKSGLTYYETIGSGFKKIVLIAKINIRDLKLVDYDRDGDMDIVQSGDVIFDAELNWWENTGGSTDRFKKKTLISRKWFINGFNIVDINSDGIYDIVVAFADRSPSLPGGVFLYISDGNIQAPNFIISKIANFQDSVEDILIIDLDKDGDIDFILDGWEYWLDNQNTLSSTNKIKMSEELSVFPSPTSHLLYINNEKAQEVELYNVNGLKVLSTAIAPRDGINVSSLPSGMYFGIITDRDGRKDRIKFVKE